MALTGAPPDAVPITVNGRVVKPHDHYAADACETNHIVLVLYENITSDQHSKLEAMQVEFKEDLGNITYLCRYEPSTLEPLRSLSWVRQVDVYRNKYKIPEELLSYLGMMKKSHGANGDEILINIMPHHAHSDTASLQELATSIQKTAGIDSKNLKVLTAKVQAKVRVDQVEEIAKDDRVRLIEEVKAVCFADAQANKIVLGSLQDSNKVDFSGDNQIVSVIDSGFDLGKPDDCHPAFNGRIKKLISICRKDANLLTEAQKCDDPKGHGTHVCGIIAGQPIDTAAGRISGVAPNARLVVSSILNSEGDTGIIQDLIQALMVPYHEQGARIFSNSWGDDAHNGQRSYGSDAFSIDVFVKNRPDALVIFSAGNNQGFTLPGRKPTPMIGSQAAAKNCLTVGATGSTREAGRDNPSASYTLDPDKIHESSSRGPTKESRIKPDVVAPGFNIMSSQSRHPAVLQPPGRPKKSLRVVNREKSGVEASWETRTGTSQATPLVAGCAAILRERAEKIGCRDPPAALLKAVIINGADKLPNVDVEAQGFGRINVVSSVKMLQQRPIVASECVAGALQAPVNHGTLIGNWLGKRDVFEIILMPNSQIQQANSEFKVTLVYDDLPGGEIQNNLNLVVIDTVTGIVAKGYESEDDIKVQNNVEQVVISSVPVNPLKIRVVAQKLFPKAWQDFVLAWAILQPYTGYENCAKASNTIVGMSKL